MNNNNNNNNYDGKRTIPVCFSSEQVKFLEQYAKEKGMVNCSQAVEYVIAAKRDSR